MKRALKYILPSRFISFIRVVLAYSRGLPRKFLFMLAGFFTNQGEILSVKKAHSFFGYYDVSPFNSTNNKILAACYTGDLSSPHDKANVNLYLGYFSNRKFHQIAKTVSWNWQQGARYQWLDEPKDIVIYNDYRNNDFCAVIHDINQDRELNVLSRPIYTISKENNSALTLDFTRLHYFRKGYGYHNKQIETPVTKCPKGDGVWAMDLSSNKVILLIDYDEILDCKRRDEFKNAYHYLNHLSYSPNGKKLLFFHIWQSERGQRSCRMMVADSNGKNLASYAETYRASHFCWISNSEIILTGLDKDKILRYVLINVDTSTSKVLQNKFLSQDGHPSVVEDTTIITDTYPDLLGFQHLNIVDFESNKGQALGRFYIPAKFTGELRCDLHPRLNHDKRMVCVDMVYKNRRAMCVLPIKV